MTTGIPYPVQGTVSKIKPENPWPGVHSEYEIEFTPKHTIQVGGGVLIVYPPQITPHPTMIKKVIVTVDGMVVD